MRFINKSLVAFAIASSHLSGCEEKKDIGNPGESGNGSARRAEAQNQEREGGDSLKEALDAQVVANQRLLEIAGLNMERSAHFDRSIQGMKAQVQQHHQSIPAKVEAQQRHLDGISQSIADMSGHTGALEAERNLINQALNAHHERIDTISGSLRAKLAAAARKKAPEQVPVGHNAIQYVHEQEVGGGVSSPHKATQHGSLVAASAVIPDVQAVVLADGEGDDNGGPRIAQTDVSFASANIATPNGSGLGSSVAAEIDVPASPKAGVTAVTDKMAHLKAELSNIVRAFVAKVESPEATLESLAEAERELNEANNKLFDKYPELSLAETSEILDSIAGETEAAESLMKKKMWRLKPVPLHEVRHIVNGIQLSLLNQSLKQYNLMFWKSVEPLEHAIRESEFWNRDITESDIQELKRQAGVIDPELTDEERLIGGFRYTLRNEFERALKEKLLSSESVDILQQRVDNFKKLVADPRAVRLNTLLEEIGSEQQPGEEIAKQFIEDVVVPFANQCKAALMEKEALNKRLTDLADSIEFYLLEQASKAEMVELWEEVEPVEEAIRTSQAWGKTIFESDIEELKRRAGVIDPQLTDEERLVGGFSYTLGMWFDRKYKKKLMASDSLIALDAQLRQTRESLLRDGNTLNERLEEIESPQRPGEEIANKFFDDVVGPFAELHKANLIIKRFKDKQAGVLQSISTYGIRYEEEWLNGSLNLEIDGLNFAAAKAVEEFNLSSEPARARVGEGIEIVRQATEAKIREIYAVRMKEVKRSVLISELETAVSKFTNKHESEAYVTGRMAALVEEMHAVGEESMEFGSMKAEMERRAGRLDPEDSDEDREVKTMVYVSKKKLPGWVRGLALHGDDSLGNLDAAWAELERTVESEVCSRMISRVECDRSLLGELRGAYESIRREIEKKIADKTAMHRKIDELEDRAKQLSKSAKSLRALSDGFEPLRAELRDYANEIAVPVAEYEKILNERLWSLIEQAKEAVLVTDEQQPAVPEDLRSPVSDISEDQWLVAAELDSVLNGEAAFEETHALPAQCPPKSFQVGGNTVEFSADCASGGFCASVDEQFVWKHASFRTIEDRVIQLVSKTPSGSDYVQQIPADSIAEFSPECAAVSRLEKVMKPLFINVHGFAGWAIELSDPRDAIRLGIHALRAFEAIHSVGIVHGSGQLIFNMALKMNDKVPAWDQPDVLALKQMGESTMFVNPKDHTHLSPFAKCRQRDQLYRLSPGEIKGYCPTRADDMYRLSEALFKSCGSFINTNKDKVAAEWLEVKERWNVEQATLSQGMVAKESDAKYYGVLNEFHAAMFRLSNERSMEKPDYEAWISRFEEVLKNE